MSLLPVQYVIVGLGAVTGIAQAALLFTLVKSKLRREFKALSNYLALAIVMMAVALISYVRFCCSDRYEHVYWFLTFAMISLEFLVMYEVLVNALKPFGALIDLGKMLFHWAGLFLLVAAFLTALATTGSSFSRLVAAANVMERSLRLMQCGLLMLFFLFERRLGLSWRSRCMSVALGLSVAGSVELIVSYLRTQFPEWVSGLSIFNMLCYIGVIVFWLFRFALPEPRKASVLESPGKLIFQRWNEALTGYGYGQPAATSSTVESFLPGIEKTVDRVLARKVAN